MIIKHIVPLGWPRTLEETPPGPFVMVDNPDFLCFKTEYIDDAGIVAYNVTGARFIYDDGLVQPVSMILDYDDGLVQPVSMMLDER